MLADWTIMELPPHGEVLVRDNEVHVFVTKRYMPRRAFDTVFTPLIRQYGKAITKIQKGSEQQKAFVERIGFVETGEDDKNLYYEIDHVPFERRI